MQFPQVSSPMVKNIYFGKSAIEQSKLAKATPRNEQILLEIFDEFITKLERRVERENASLRP
jgi:hypothetical protein